MTIKELIENLSFELSITDGDSNFDYANTAKVQNFINAVNEDYVEALNDNKEASDLLSELQISVNQEKEKTHSLSKDDLKKVYLMLKNRELHPKGDFDSAGRFYLNDAELVDVRSPSTKYPYTQMKAGRTSKFVKAVADKYACQTIDELIERFNRA